MVPPISHCAQDCHPGVGHGKGEFVVNMNSGHAWRSAHAVSMVVLMMNTPSSKLQGEFIRIHVM